MNQHNLQLMGRATEDGSLLQSKSGLEYCKFGLAINEYNSQLKDFSPHYYDIVSFGRQAKAVSKKVHKGDVVFVHGKPEIRAYESKSGEPKAKISVHANYLACYSKPKSKQADEADLSEDSLA